tara:strand:- start:161 stop:370 length:210 start_codon:yes stop_codon:yes gene_type:complete
MAAAMGGVTMEAAVAAGVRVMVAVLAAVAVVETGDQARRAEAGFRAGESVADRVAAPKEAVAAGRAIAV